MKQPTGFGDRMRALRKAQKLSADKLADKLKISQASIAKYENEQMRPAWDKMQDLATALGTTTKYLLFGEDESSRKDGLQTACEMGRRLLDEDDLKALEALVVNFVTKRVKAKK